MLRGEPMKIVNLILGTVLLILLLIKMKKGKKYSAYIENLDEEEHPIKEFYYVGFAWNDTKFLSLRGKMKEKLFGQAKLLYPPKYAEYYALLAWAQTLSVVHLVLCAGFLLAGAFDFGFFALVGVVFAVILGIYFCTDMNNKLNTRGNECVVELPEIVSTMALLINSGMVLREAWKIIAESKEGVVYDLMKETLIDMGNGMSDIDAIYKFGIMSNSPEIKKFTSALTQGLEKGSSDLSQFLTNQSSEMWELKKQIMLQKGESAASKLLLPIAMIFIGVLVIVIASAIGMIL